MRRTLLLAFCLVAACRKNEAGEPARTETSLVALDAGLSVDASIVQVKADAGPPVEFTGTLRGAVRLAKGAKLPIAPFPQVNGITPPSAAPCPPVDESDQRSTISLSKQTGGLYPVHVALTGMNAVPHREKQTHEVFIDACRLGPTLIGAMRGDSIRVTNRSDTALIPNIPGARFARGLLRGEGFEGPLKTTRSLINCQVGVYCGEVLAVATSHPLYATTTPEGFFTIENVPLDQDLKVHAWNPLFEVSSAPFRLTHEKTEDFIELTLTPTDWAKSIKLGPPPPPPVPKRRVHYLDGGGIIVDGPGPAYE